MHHPRTFVWLAAAAGLALGAPALAQDGDDGEFVKKAASGGMLEVELGRHAAQNASNAEVRAFGQRMVTDHGAANRELEGIARREGLAVPTQMEEEHREMADNLKKLRGAELDRAYMSAMVRDHDHDVDEFQEQAEQAKSEVDRWAARTLPTLQAHLAQAEQLSERIEDAAETGAGAPGAGSREGYDPARPGGDPGRPDSGPAGPDTLRTPERP
jgi:putative membrane protein